MATINIEDKVKLTKTGLKKLINGECSSNGHLVKYDIHDPDSKDYYFLITETNSPGWKLYVKEVHVDNCSGHGMSLTDGEDFKVIKPNSTNIVMDIKAKFALAFLGEPEKTFRKADITNSDGFLTEKGQSVFLGWLLKKHGADFKTEVVDDLLKEVESK